uniref:Lipocalin/cytosolic fatty-acid binding domain-containing protein n=1 Tax=Clastoptera arizonana TaxID=38151 RepID=A0A1B6CQM0_9HEMI
MLYQVLITLCLAWSASADCRVPPTVANFNLKGIEGVWFIKILDFTNLADNVIYGAASCATLNLTIDSPQPEINQWRINMNLAVLLPLDVGAQFFRKTPSGDVLRLYFPIRDVFYDVYTVCTDYSTYVIHYACENTTVYGRSEIIFVSVKDLSQYENVINSSEVQRCLSLISNKAVAELNEVEHDNCSYNSLISIS